MIQKSDTAALLGLLSVPGIGPASVMRLYDWADERHVGLGEALSDPEARRCALRRSHDVDPEKIYEKAIDTISCLSSRGVHLIDFRDSRYPRLLKSRLGRRCPPLLTAMGNIDLLNHRSVGFCGSRNASAKGLGVAADCAEQLAGAGINVLSGYATGVDMTTHLTALRSGGTTIVVLAEGILRFRLKPEISSDWDWHRVVALSEFPPNLPWQVQSAMQRNKTICALSDAMVLIEARASGGSIDAGRAALRLGVSLFAAVYEGMPEWATGNRELLQEGAQSLLKNRSTDRANLKPLLQHGATG